MAQKLWVLKKVLMMEVVNCLVWNLDPWAFRLGGASMRWYGLSFGLGIFLGYFMLKWQFRRANHPSDSEFILFVYLYFGGIAGAYLGHRIFYEWSQFISDPAATISLSGGVSGLSSHGATIGILTAIYLFSRRNKIGFLETVDRSTFGVALVAIFVRLGNLANSEIVGKETSLPWAFCFPAHDAGQLIARHPSQIYEALMGLLVLIGLIIGDRWAGGEKRPQGFLLGLFAMLYFGMRFVVEFFKAPLVFTEGSMLTMGQYLSLPFVVIGLVMIWLSFKRRYQKGEVL